jgi:hypothetical protein
MVSRTMRARWKRAERKLDRRTFEEMQRDIDRARDKRALEAWVRLWKQGDYSSRQGRLDVPRSRLKA